MHPTRHPLGLAGVLLALALALVLSACADDEPTVDTGTDDESAETDDDTGDDDMTDDDGGDDGEDGDGGMSAAVTLELGESDVGEHLVDGDGNTVYMFNPDEQGEPTCTGGCADSWPAVTADGEVDVGDELDAGLVGTVASEDGGEQVTYNDWPLYYFSGDQSPGDVNGQGVNDVWWVLDADGEPIEG